MPTKNTKWYRRVLPTAHRLMLDRTVDPMLAEMTGDNLIIGAGYDPYLALMKKARSVLLTDVDGSNTVIDHVVDAHQMNFEDASFDGVVAIEVFEHLRDPALALSEVFRVLRPGGIVLVSMPFLFRVHGDPSDFQRYTEFGMRELFKGFQSVNVTAFGGRSHAISDIVTTACKPMAVFRIINHILAVPLLSKPASRDCPSGYVVYATKSHV